MKDNYIVIIKNNLILDSKEEVASGIKQLCMFNE